MSEHLFVYGTLMRRAGHVMGLALSRNAEWIGEAVFTGRLYLVASYPGVVASTDPDDGVFGELFKLTEARFLSRLDDYEGCGPRAREPTEYVRELHDVRLGGATLVQAWIYLYNRPVHGFSRIRSGRFLEHDLVREAGRVFGQDHATRQRERERD